MEVSAGVMLQHRDFTVGEPVRVLLVDDDGFLREIVSDTLRDMGLEIAEAPSGVLAVEMLRKQPDRFDALVTDLTLPGGMSGADVAAVMQEMRPEAPVVLTSGDVDALTQKAKPGLHTLAKPFLAADLFRLLSTHSRRGRHRSVGRDWPQSDGSPG